MERVNDTGEADPRLASALHQPQDRAELLAALVDARVFAAITATSTAEHLEEHTGLRAESGADMAVNLLEAPDGSRALPVFQDLQALKRWSLEARPVPLTGAQACQAARDEGATAVLLDPAGAAVVVTELETLSDGWVPVQNSALAARHAVTALQAPTTDAPADLVRALRHALVGEPLRSARLLQGPDGWVLGVAPEHPATPHELAELAHRIVTSLGPDLPREGLGLAQVGRKGPGQEVLRRGLLRRGR